MQNWKVAVFLGVCGLAAVACEKNDTAAVSAARPEASSPDVPEAAAALPEPTAAATIPAPPDVAAAPADAKKTASGLASKVLTPGTGKDHPGPNDTVKVHYTGWTKTGKMFDSSVIRGEPISFPLNDVIPGWTEGLQLMVVGEKRRLWIPAALAYGDRPRPGGARGRPGLRRRAARDHAGAEAPAGSRGREGAARDREEDRVRARLPRPHEGDRHVSPEGHEQRHRALLGLDDGRKDVRQLRHARAARALLVSTTSSRAGPRACSS